MATKENLVLWEEIQRLYNDMNKVRAKFNDKSKIAQSEYIEQVTVPPDQSPNLAAASAMTTLKSLIEDMNRNHYINPSATLSNVPVATDLLKASDINDIDTQLNDVIYPRCVNDSTNFTFSFGSNQTFGFSSNAGFGFSFDAGFGFSSDAGFGFSSDAGFGFSSDKSFGFSTCEGFSFTSQDGFTFTGFWSFTFGINYGACTNDQAFCTRLFGDTK